MLDALFPQPDLETRKRMALTKVYAVLIRVAEKKETALPENFGEDTGRAGVDANNNTCYPHSHYTQKE